MWIIIVVTCVSTYDFFVTTKPYENSTFEALNCVFAWGLFFCHLCFNKQRPHTPGFFIILLGNRPDTSCNAPFASSAHLLRPRKSKPHIHLPAALPGIRCSSVPAEHACAMSLRRPTKSSSIMVLPLLGFKHPARHPKCHSQ